MKLSKIILITFICSLIFSVVFVTVQRIDIYFNPSPVPVESKKKIE